MLLQLYLLKRIGIALLIIGFSLQNCVPIDQSSSAPRIQKKLVNDDEIYEPNIRTVQLYKSVRRLEDEVQAAVVSINDESPLILEFDDLYAEIKDYRAYIIHCNADWTKSDYIHLDFLNGFNEFPIREYEFSINTRTEYVHYLMTLPRVKLSGNYLLVVYRGTNTDDIILSRRFMVYRGLIDINAEIKLSSGVLERRQNHQLDFSIDYSGVKIDNPLEEIKVILKQNQRWDNAITKLKPTMLKESRNIIEYFHWNLENNFKAGNEFRFFDLRIVNATGQNVARIDKTPEDLEAFLVEEKFRNHEAYGQYLDINGKYVINNLETGQTNGDFDADYVTVNFFLRPIEGFNEDIYVFGALTDWKTGEKNKMKFDTTRKLYTTQLFLKQGWYNYIFLIKNSSYDPHYIEGLHFETENQYEILVYYRPLISKGDQLIGYSSIIHNKRNR